MSNEKGEMFTFVYGKYTTIDMPNVCIFEGKVKFKKKELKKFNDLFDKWFLTHPDYIHGIQMDKFERIFGKKLKAGEVRHGRLKLRLTKRKKK